MSNQEELPEPDDFGIIPPQEQELQKGPETVDPIIEHLKNQRQFYFYEENDYIKKGGPSEEVKEKYTGFILDGMVDLAKNYNLINISFGSAGISKSEVSEAQPVEKPDPYPSRAGWRADYLPPHDPFAEEPKDRPKGKIGEYEVIESVTTFDDIGGNIKPKELLLEVANQFEDPEQYEAWDVPTPKGILLYGGPGTGKTMLAKAFANRANAAFIEVPTAKLRDKYFGESEKSLKRLFDEAAKHKGQVVIFFDEIDSLLPNRSLLHPEGPDIKLVNTFLQAMDGMSSASNVMVLGATNYPERLDEAATRPGRFDQKVEVELPDKAGCRDIAARRLLSAERNAKRILVEDNLNLEEISRYLQGLSGADITEILNRVKRTMAQTERAMRKQALLGIEFDNEDRASLRITTDDVIETAIGYRFQR